MTLTTRLQIHGIILEFTAKIHYIQKRHFLVLILKEEIKNVCQNRRAYHDYNIISRYEAGISLTGSEVKSVRERKMHLTDAYVEARNGELYLVNAHISEYPNASIFNHKPKRERKLLMHRSEITRLESRVNEKGFTIIPLSVYFKGSKIKIEIGIATGKRQYDKREEKKKKDAEREMRRKQ
jgi:SsrA-binding protein